jgi:uncharacterized protein (DUF58 family)
MNRHRVLLLLLGASIAGAVGSGRALWWAVAGALAALLAIAALWSWSSIHWLRVSRRSRTQTAVAGDVFEEEFRLANLSALPRLWVEVRDHSTLPRHRANRVLSHITGRQWRGWRTRSHLLRRGRYRLGPLDISSGDPLGIYQVRRRIPITSTLLVQPYAETLQSFPFPVSPLPDGEALRRRTHSVTASASGVREYAPGDGMRRIHWPSSARRQRLMVKEFELDPAADVHIVLDLDAGPHIESEFIAESAHEAADNFDPDEESLAPRAAALPRSTVEYAVSAAASCARFFLAQGRSVGLIAVGAHREIIAAERSERQHWRIMETLAVVAADGRLPFAHVLTSECASLPRGTTLVLISPSTQVDWAETAQGLVRAGQRVVALAIDPAGFGDAPADAPADACDALLSALADAGATARRIRCGASLQSALDS